ncbi:hypothetical protein [Desulfosediminicola flagellatus]|uniref:hypothetical protein n=1 Tax=Desulfosediminicola flagellatus TaxID=2569541 RepID=UPI0010AB520F|nr:hypothetical protein [Desulfosediminicola flagellatus]
MKLKLRFNRQTLAILYLVVLCVQYVPVEGWGVSPIKAGFMMIAPVVSLAYFRKVPLALFAGLLYLVMAFYTAYFVNGYSFRSSTFLYHLLFVSNFAVFVGLLESRAFSLGRYIQVLERLVFAFAICLVAQQLLIVAGIRTFPPLNLMQFLDRGLGAQSLALEPSHCARLITVLFLSLLRLYTLASNSKVMKLRFLWQEKRWVFVAFLWSMTTMGSGTAFIGLGIVGLYFLKRQYLLIAIPVVVALFYVIPHIENESFQRAHKAIIATSTVDTELIIQEDGSAATRIVPILNTLHLDLSDPEVWFGSGIDAGIKSGLFGEKQTLGCIGDYGLLAYICFLGLMGVTVFARAGLLEWLVFIFLLGGGAGNIAYVWGALMVMAGVNYFRRQAARRRLHRSSRIYLRVPHRLAERGGA